MAATVTLEPAGHGCWDEPVRIVVRGLAPEQPVTLRASLRDERGALFQAHARYCADAGGELDLTRAPALGGSFAGLEPMGLFWALEPEKPFLRLAKRDVQTPFAVELEVLDGHELETERILSRAVHERDFLGPGVRREPVRAGRVRATLFLPPGEPPAFQAALEVGWSGRPWAAPCLSRKPHRCGTFLNWSRHPTIYLRFGVEFISFTALLGDPVTSLAICFKVHTTYIY